MGDNNRPMMTTPRLVINSCSSDDDQQINKSEKENNRRVRRSWSLTNFHQTYKDLQGAIHASFSSNLIHLHTRSRSYPNNYLSVYSKANEKYFLFQTSSPSTHMNINNLDPNGGTQTPGGSSSRYSLCGSFFDLSESSYYPSTDQFHSRSEKLLTAGGQPLLFLDYRTRPSTNTFQDKCNDWLRQLNTNPT